MKFAVMSSGTTIRYHPFDTVKKLKKHIVSKLKENPNMTDVATALNDMKELDKAKLKPTRKLSSVNPWTGTGTTRALDAELEHKRKIEQEGLDIEHCKAIEVWELRECQYDAGMISAYSKIMNNFTTEGIKGKVEQLANHEAEIENKPIKLLEALKTLAHDGTTVQYRWKTVFVALKRMTSTDMEDNEKPNDFRKKVKSVCDVVEQLLGKHWLREVIKNDTEYTQLAADKDAERDALCETAWAEFQAYIMLHGAHPLKYGSLKQQLTRDMSLKTDKYPKTLTAMNEHIGSHTWDSAWSEQQKKKRQQQAQRKEEQVQLAQANHADLTCHCCGKTGHISPNCKDKNRIDRKDWWINTVVQAHQASREEEDSQSDQAEEAAPAPAPPPSSSRRSGRSSTPRPRGSRSNSVFQSLQLQGEYEDVCFATDDGKKQSVWHHLKDLLLLDSGSTCHSIMNGDLVSEIRRAKNPVRMSTNIGVKRIDLESQIPGVGTTQYDPAGIANILGLGKLIESGYRVTMDTEVEMCFNVYFPGDKEPIKFHLTKEGLFAYKPTEKYLKQVAKQKSMAPPELNSTYLPSNQDRHITWYDDEVTLATEDETDYESEDDWSTEDALQGFDIDVVKENMKYYTNRQIANGKRARELQTDLGCTTRTLKTVIKSRLIDDNPVTPAHVDIAEGIWGKDIPKLKGSTKRSQPKAVIDDLIQLPPEIYEKHPDLTLEIDIMYVNRLPMLTGIDTTLKYRSFEPLTCRTITEIHRALKTFLRTYNRGGFKITRIDCDNEFRPLLDKIEIEVEMNFANPGDHCPHVERNNQTVKERIRAILHGLPFKYFPKQLIRAIGIKATKGLNILPAKDGVSDRYGPHSLMTSRNLKYSDFMFPIGSYVQADEETNPRNSNEERTSDCIYLYPADNRQDGHEVMHIQTGEIVKRRKLTRVPMTQAVIDAVHKLAKRQGVRKSFKIESRVDIPIIPADWIAGVDHDLYEVIDPNDYSDDESESANQTMKIMKPMIVNQIQMMMIL